MVWVLAGLLVVSVCFAAVLLFGAPFLPTLRKQVHAALDLLDLQAGQTLLELGSGDGRVLREAAKRGINGIGYEINPLLVLYSWAANFKYRKLVKVYWRNFWRVPLPPADGVYVFLLKPYMQRLDDKVTRDLEGPIKVVSFAFAFPHKKPAKQTSGLMLYVVGRSGKT